MLTNKQKKEEQTDLKGMIRINCQTNLIGQKTIDQTKKVKKRLEMILPAVKGHHAGMQREIMQSHS